jgi:hypothetical protein
MPAFISGEVRLRDGVGILKDARFVKESKHGAHILVIISPDIFQE